MTTREEALAQIAILSDTAVDAIKKAKQIAMDNDLPFDFELPNLPDGDYWDNSGCTLDEDYEETPPSQWNSSGGPACWQKGKHVLLIGSGALEHILKLDRSPRDLDIIGGYDEAIAFAKHKMPGDIRSCMPIDKGKKLIIKKTTGQIIEIEIAWEGSTAESFLELVEGFEHDIIPYAPLDALYTLKMSHRYLRNSPAFMKTMEDIKLMREHGAKIPDYLKDWYQERMDETYWYQHPSLDRSKQDFFTPDVPYLYDHDTIHEAVKHLDKPAYQYFKPEDKEVWCSKEMWDELSLETQLYATLEETYVLALERSQVPYSGKVTPHKSFAMALKKVCSSITSGWFREFSWEHFDEVRTLYNENYVDRFWKALEAGEIKHFA